MKAGLSEDLILSTINSTAWTLRHQQTASSPSNPTASAKGSGATAKNNAPAPLPIASATAPPANNADDPTPVHSPGIYILAMCPDGKVHLTKLDHVVPKQAKTSGVFASAFTYGAVKAHMKGVVDGSKAQVQTPDTDPVFYAYIPEDNTTFGGSSISVKDFSLIKFDVKGQQREVNLASVSMWGASQGVDGKATQGFSSDPGQARHLQVQSDQTARRWRVRLPAERRRRLPPPTRKIPDPTSTSASSRQNKTKESSVRTEVSHLAAEM